MKTFTVNAAEVRATRKRAARQGKQAIWLIKFPGFVMECRVLPDGWEPEQ